MLDSGTSTYPSNREHRAGALAGLLLVLFFSSGATALIYEVVWRRMLALTVGGSIYATSLVLAAFMGGLALGAVVVGRRADSWANPLRAYAIIELAAGLCGALILIGMPVVRTLYASMAGALPPSPVTANLLRAPVVLAILLPPTFLMGATFPVMTRHYLSIKPAVGRGLGELYAVNTAGAVAGTVLAGMFLIRSLGVVGTSLVAIALSFAIGSAALFLSKGAPKVASRAQRSCELESQREEALLPAGIVAFALAASGFAALSYEVLWTRVLVYLVGNSTYSFTIMLSCFLVGLAAGAGLFRLLERRVNYVVWAVGIQAVIALAALLLIPLSDSLYAMGNWLSGASGSVDLSLRYFRHFVLTLVVLLPTTVFLGMAFPLLARLYVGGREAVGRRVGGAYGINSLGAAAGALAAVFLLIPQLQIRGAIVATAAVNLAVALAILWRAPAIASRRKAVVACAVLTVFLICAGVRREGIDVGRWMDGWSGERGEQLYYHEGVSSTVAVFRDPAGGRKILQTDGVGQVPTDLDSMQVFKLMGHLPFFVQPEAQTVLVTAFGGGITAGAILTHPVERVDVVEICPGVLEASSVFVTENRGALSDPRLTVHLADAAEYVRRRGPQYDVIVSDSTHPGAAESWVLYTRDFYAACRDRLKPGGVMCQWVPLHGLSVVDYRTVLRTFQSVFPHTTLWLARGYTILLATSEPLRIDPKAIDLLLSDSRIGADLRSVNLDSAQSVLRNLMLDSASVRALAGEGPIATDNRSPLEFPSAAGSGKSAVAENLTAVSTHQPESLAGLVAGAASGETPPAWDRLRRLYLKGIEAFRADRPEAAVDSLLAANALAPDDRDVLSFLERAGEEAARGFVAAGGLDRREPLLGRLAGLFPDSAVLQMAWGLSLIQVTAKTHEAEPARRGIARLREAVRLAPDDPYVLDVVSQACLSMEAWSAALPLLKRLAKLQPDNPAVLCNLARAQIGLKQFEEAERTLNRTLRISPAFSPARELLGQLEARGAGKEVRMTEH